MLKLCFINVSLEVLLTYGDDNLQLSDATTNMSDSSTWNRIPRGRKKGLR